MRTAGLAALLVSTLAFTYPFMQQRFGLPYIAVRDSQVVALLSLMVGGIALIAGRRS